MKKHKLQHFETFIAIVEQGGFTAAARKLDVSKGAVSHSIRLLESELGVPLIIRDTRNMELTEEGERLYAQCLRIQSELQDAENLIANFQGKPSGTLRISVNPHLAEHRLLPLIEQYQFRFPEVNLEIITEERMPDIQAEQIDIVFGVNWPAPDDIVSRTIGETRYVLCASPQYLKKFGTPKSVNELQQYHYIAHSGRSPQNLIADLKKPLPNNFTPYLSMNNASLMRAAALKHWGIVQLHDYVIENELKTGALIELCAEDLKSKIPLYVYYVKHRFVQPKIRQFVQLLFQETD